MSFLNPSALWLSLLAIPLVALYALKVRPPRVSVATTMFWKSSAQQKTPWSPSYRLRDLVSLVLQLVLLALLVIALAEPQWGSAETSPRLVVFVLDNSASMSATDVRPSRFEAAKSEALRLIDKLSGEDQAAVVTAAGVPQLACRTTRLRSALRLSIDGALQSDAPVHLEDAISLASRIRSPGERHLVVISDRPLPVDDRHGFDDVHLVAIGTAANNLAITRFQARRNVNDPSGYQVLIELQNNSRQAEECRLELSLAGQVIDVVPLELAPGQVWHRVLDESSTSGGRLAARIDADDALALDNEAWSILPERSTRKVYLVGRDSLFLQQVFEAQPQIDVQLVDELPSQVERGAVLVLDRQSVQQLPTGPVLVIEPVESIAEWECGELSDVSYVANEAQSTLLQNVQLDDVAFHNVRELNLLVPADVALRGINDQPLLFTIPREGGDVVVFNFSVDKGDLPLRTSFPILVSNVLDRLSNSSGEMSDSYSTGEIVRLKPGDLDLDLNEGDLALLLHSPSGIVREQMVSLREAMVGPLDECGVWGLEIPAKSENAEARTSEIACNLCNEEESNLLVDGGERPELSSLYTSDLSAGWMYVVVAAIFLSLAEWALYHRRWIQ